MRPEDYYPVISPRPDCIPEYFEALQEGPKQANDYIMNFYAGWVLAKRQRYRHLIVVHPDPEKVVYWTDDYKHLEDVITPQQCIGKRFLEFILDYDSFVCTY
jgi:chromo domain-containing protein 1